VEGIASVRGFLDESGFGDAERHKLQGDASTRSYERLVRDGESYILMNSPRRPDGPPVRDGKSYSEIAHLAEDVRAFMALAAGLRDLGYSAPAIYHADSEKGLLILENLGDERIVEGDPPAPIAQRYERAVDFLIDLHTQKLPPVLPISPHVEYALPRYDADAFLIELELLLDWYLPRLNATISPATRAAFFALWRDALQPALDAPLTWVLRDFHSPNLLWLPERDETARLGILDFQDAVLGPAAYDLASLLQDARVDIPEAMEIALLGRYARARRAADATFEPAAFVKVYATLAAQRATKILGIFARLDRRDGKSQYLRHMPRIWNYLQRSLAHPALAPLRAWYATHVPTVKSL
jgi:aminoglycoside/choline kinase family phosphotransferase